MVNEPMSGGVQNDDPESLLRATYQALNLKPEEVELVRICREKSDSDFRKLYDIQRDLFRVSQDEKYMRSAIFIERLEKLQEQIKEQKFKFNGTQIDLFYLVEHFGNNIPPGRDTEAIKAMGNQKPDSSQ